MKAPVLESERLIYKPVSMQHLSEEYVVSTFLPDRIKSLLCVPMRIGDRLVGAIHVAAATPLLP
jgi:GAF domain-containing protein